MPWTPENTTHLTRRASFKRPTVAGLALTACVAAAGCMPPGQPVAEPVNTTPVVVDEAMDKRDWEPTPAYYANGDTYAGHTRFWAYQPGQARPAWQQLFVDPFVFMGQVAYLPITYFQVKPFKPLVTQGEVIGPTYYGVPPVPEVEPAPPAPPKKPTVEVDDRDVVNESFPDGSKPRARSISRAVDETETTPAVPETVSAEAAPETAPSTPSETTPTEAPATAPAPQPGQ